MFEQVNTFGVQATLSIIDKQWICWVTMIFENFYICCFEKNGPNEVD